MKLTEKDRLVLYITAAKISILNKPEKAHKTTFNAIDFYNWKSVAGRGNDRYARERARNESGRIENCASDKAIPAAVNWGRILSEGVFKYQPGFIPVYYDATRYEVDIAALNCSEVADKLLNLGYTVEDFEDDITALFDLLMPSEDDNTTNLIGDFIPLDEWNKEDEEENEDDC